MRRAAAATTVSVGAQKRGGRVTSAPSRVVLSVGQRVDRVPGAHEPLAQAQGDVGAPSGCAERAQRGARAG